MFVLDSKIEISPNCMVLKFASALQHTFSLTSALFTATSGVNLPYHSVFIGCARRLLG